MQWVTLATSALLEKALETVSKSLEAGSLQGRLPSAQPQVFSFEPLYSHGMSVMVCAVFVSTHLK